MTTPVAATDHASEDDIRTALAGILRTAETRRRQPEMGVGTDDLAPGRAYLTAMAEGGWAVPTWPARYGGRDASAEDAATIARVLGEFDVPDLYAFMIGLYMAGPTLMAHGQESQCDRWLPSIADGRDVWCQLFSEPEAGSDLANLALRATDHGGAWQLDGQKLWVSRSMWADWGLLLARTDPEAPKHRGLTMFVVDMRATGVDVRPLVQINGDRHFAEVFFDHVVVGDDQRVGDVGAGWTVAMTVLAHERALSGESEPASLNWLPPWLQDVGEGGALDHPVRRDRAMRALITSLVTTLTAIRARDEQAAGPTSWGSVAKLLKARQFRDTAYLTTDAAGADGMLRNHPGHLQFLTAPSMSIRGGTDEIQKNIIGERLLGLPPEPRLDKDVAWTFARRGLSGGPL